MASADLRVLELESKEGLALINGTHFMAAIGALLLPRIRSLIDSIDLICGGHA